MGDSATITDLLSGQTVTEAAVSPENDWPTFHQGQQDPNDHFIKRDGMEYAGNHLIFDFWDCTELNNLELMDKALRECVDACKATLLHIHLHHFTPNEGISGVAVLAESHISVHTWPERGFAAFDVFMCGDAQPEKSIAVLKKHFKPGHIQVTEQLRGIVSEQDFGS